MVTRIRWTPELVNGFWDGVAQTELNSLSFGRVAGPRLLELVGSFLLPGRSCLDFGAGSGHLLELLLQRGLKVAGFEPAPDRRDQLVARIGKHQNFLGIKGPETNEQFDIVFLMEVIEHILEENFAQVLDRVIRFVKPGGVLIVTTPNNENLELASVYCPISDTLFHPWQHVRSFTPAQLSNLFANIGFSAEFVALADFSSDAELIETYKKNTALEAMKDASLRQLTRAIESSIESYWEQRRELENLTLALQAGENQGLWRRIKLRIKLLLRHREFIGRLHAVACDVSHRFDETSSFALDQLSRTAALVLGDLHQGGTRSDGIDLRIGKESTIVYVGRKLHSAALEEKAHDRV